MEITDTTETLDHRWSETEKVVRRVAVLTKRIAKRAKSNIEDADEIYKIKSALGVS